MIAATSTQEPLKFKVAPHIVQDLGLNLYTSLPRVLVEYIANAYDADSRTVQIRLDAEKIAQQRKIVKQQYELDKANSAAHGTAFTPLTDRTLPDDVRIEISDSGHGMSRSDLNDKFLVAGKRRRGQNNSDQRSDGGRLVMGRKGLGKLAGFGVAKVVTVISKTSTESHATQVTLCYDDLVRVTGSHEIEIEEEVLVDGGGIDTQGTRIILSRLLYEPMGAKLTTIGSHAADHFSMIDPADFEIKLNDDRVEPSPRAYSYAWPCPEEPTNKYIKDIFESLDGQTYEFSFRMRFASDRQALPAKERGVRVYAHKRLAAAPSLLEADTNMHGFRMTDYLDGVVHADFLDDQKDDYISTDRQSLRWESPLLSPLYEKLSGYIKQACIDRQKVRDHEKEEETKGDTFTNQIIENAELTKREQKAALRIASVLSSTHKQGFNDPAYRVQFEEVISAMGRGEIIATLHQLSLDENPEFKDVVLEVMNLTSEQIDGYLKFAKARIDGIIALEKIVSKVNFKDSKNEKELHDLLSKCPWLIDPMFFDFVTSNQQQQSVHLELARELGIESYVPEDYDPDTKEEAEPGGANERPDLVFLLANDSKIVIVELKAPNTPLHIQHLEQLRRYVGRTEKWLKKQQRSARVEGLLIGSHGPIASRAKDVESLDYVVEKMTENDQLRVIGIGMLLERARTVHKDLLKSKEESDSASNGET